MILPWEGGQDPREETSEEDYARLTRQEWYSSRANLMGKGIGHMCICNSKSVSKGASEVRLDRQTECRL